MHRQRKVHHQRVGGARQQPTEIIDDPEQQEHSESDQRRDDLVRRQRRGQESDANQRGAEQQQAEIARVDRAEIWIAEPGESGGVGTRQQEHDSNQAHCSEVFCQDDRNLRDRRGQENLQRLQFPLLGEQAHGDQRRREPEQHEHLEEDVHHAGLMAEKQRQREAVAHDQEEHSHQHIGDRRRKQRRLFFLKQHRKTSHAASPGRLVRSRNTRSRSGRTSVSSDTATSAATSAATRSAGSDARRSAQIR